MSQPPLQPDYYREPARIRPPAVTVLAIIGIVLGAYGFLCKPFGIVAYFINFQEHNTVLDQIKADHALFFWIIATTAMSWVLSTLLLIFSIAALGLREWSRRGLLGWAVAAIVVTVIEIAVQYTVVMPKITDMMKHATTMPASQTGQIAGYVIMLIFGFLWPAIMLIFMTRRDIRQAFVLGAQPAI